MKKPVIFLALTLLCSCSAGISTIDEKYDTQNITPTQNIIMVDDMNHGLIRERGKNIYTSLSENLKKCGINTYFFRSKTPPADEDDADLKNEISSTHADKVLTIDNDNIIQTVEGVSLRETLTATLSDTSLNKKIWIKEFDIRSPLFNFGKTDPQSDKKIASLIIKSLSDAKIINGCQKDKK